MGRQSRNLLKKKPLEANMGRQSCKFVEKESRRMPIWDVKIANLLKKKPAGNEYGTPKLQKTLNKSRRRPLWNPKAAKQM